MYVAQPRAGLVGALCGPGREVDILLSPFRFTQPLRRARHRHECAKALAVEGKFDARVHNAAAFTWKVFTLKVEGRAGRAAHVDAEPDEA